MAKIQDPIVVVLSGGQDSTTCLALALRDYRHVEALTFDYGQRHAREIEAATVIAKEAGVDHRVISLRGFGEISRSALTDPAVAVDAAGGLGGLPSTFTPGRNLVFLTMAASYAISRGVRRLMTGVCQTDYSGYPDCRRDTIDALETAIMLGNDPGAQGTHHEIPPFDIYTPLMHLTKRETVLLAVELGALPLLRHTVTCYHGADPACGTCPACLLRLRGFQEAGIPDPMRYAEASA